MEANRPAFPRAADLPAAEPPSFEQVYRDCSPRVYRYCLSQLGDPGEAEDVAADVFAAAFARYPPAWSDGVVLPWLLRIARNQVIDHRRRRSRRSALVARFAGGQTEADPGVNVEGQVVLRDELRRVIAAAARLSARDRTLIGLRLAAGLRYAELGEVLGMTEHAATVATRRALQRLRRHLEVLP